jgi:hypothetical protein
VSKLKSAGICLASGIIGLLILSVIGQEAVTDETSFGACMHAQFAVVEKLKVPRTAEFSACRDDTATKQPDGTWAVGGYVDARNDLGARIRSVFLVRIAYSQTTKKWSVTDVEVEQRS